MGSVPIFLIFSLSRICEDVRKNAPKRIDAKATWQTEKGGLKNMGSIPIFTNPAPGKEDATPSLDPQHKVPHPKRWGLWSFVKQ